MAQKLKVGIIGVGTIGTVHSESYQAAGEAADLAAICDIRPERLSLIGDRFKVKNRYDDYHKLLASDVDAVSVCVPNALHKEIAVAALRAGKHVLLEKPMAMNPAEGQEIVAAARQSNKVGQLGMVRRQDPAAQLVRDYIQQGLLGEIYHMRAVLIRRRGIPGLGGWFTTKAISGGGPLIDVGVHWFDLLMWLSDQWKPTAASAMTYDKFGGRMRDYKYVSMWAGPPNYDGVFDVEDYAAGMVRFGRKASMTFDIAWAANAQSDSFVEVMGDKGGMRLMDGESLKLYTEFQGRPADICPQFDKGPKAFHVQASKFLAACRGEIPPAATFEQGLTALRLIDAIYASSQSGKEAAIG